MQRIEDMNLLGVAISPMSRRVVPAAVRSEPAVPVVRAAVRSRLETRPAGAGHESAPGRRGAWAVRTAVSFGERLAAGDPLALAEARRDPVSARRVLDWLVGRC